MRSTTVLAVDIGTSGVRVGIVGDDGAVHAVSRVARSAGDSRRFDPAALWADVTEAVRGVDGALRRAVDAVGVAAFIGTVLVDGAGDPIGTGHGWGDHSGVDAFAGRLGSDLPAALRRAGRPEVTGGAGPVLLHAQDHEPERWARVDTVLTPKDFVVARLTGVRATDPTSAAYSLCSDVRSLEWSRETIDAAGLPMGLFPPQVLARSIVGGVLSSVAETWGIRVDTPVVAGGPDGTVGAYGAACGRDLVVDIAGTTDVLAHFRSDPNPSSRRVLVNPAIEHRQWTAGGSTGLTGGAVTRWTDLMAPSGGQADLLERALSLPQRPRGLFVGPFLSGSRFPRWHGDERGWVRGHSEEHGAADLVRAAIEAAAFVVREGLDEIDPRRSLEVLLTGGSARSSALAQLRADVFGRVVHTRSDPDATLHAVARLALPAPPSAPSSDLGFGRSYFPDAARSSSADDAYGTWTGFAEDAFKNS